MGFVTAVSKEGFCVEFTQQGDESLKLIGTKRMSLFRSGEPEHKSSEVFRKSTRAERVFGEPFPHRSSRRRCCLSPEIQVSSLFHGGYSEPTPTVTLLCVTLSPRREP